MPDLNVAFIYFCHDSCEMKLCRPMYFQMSKLSLLVHQDSMYVYLFSKWTAELTI